VADHRSGFNFVDHLVGVTLQLETSPAICT
jgi:hypothetical protein